MTNVLLVCPMDDGQTGVYVHDALIKLGHKVAFFDHQHVATDEGFEKMNTMLVSAVEQLKPDITIILKGLGIVRPTIDAIRKVHDHKIVGWIFDVTLGGTYVKDGPEAYIDFIKSLDAFYTVDRDALPELKKLGITAKWLQEACALTQHTAPVFNSVQKRKYGGEVVFLGSVGTIHPNRAKILKRVYDEGIPLHIYGRVHYNKDEEPDWVKDSHTGFEAINDYHSLVCNASKVVLGIDGWDHRDQAYSARLFRVLCAGGFYLTTHTKNMEEFFTPGKHLDTYKDEDELVEKLYKYLQDDDLRATIAEEGRKEVVEKHQFIHRMKELLENEGFNEED